MPFVTGMCVVPYDHISDNFRGTMGIFEDLLEIPEKIARANEMIAGLQIKYLNYLERVPMKVKRENFEAMFETARTYGKK